MFSVSWLFPLNFITNSPSHEQIYTLAVNSDILVCQECQGDKGDTALPAVGHSAFHSSCKPSSSIVPLELPDLSECLRCPFCSPAKPTVHLVLQPDAITSSDRWMFSNAL